MICFKNFCTFAFNQKLLTFTSRKNLDRNLLRKKIAIKNCDIRPEWSIRNFAFEFLLEHLTGKIDGFFELVTLIGRSDKSGRVCFD